jgi:hypothetical protein
VNGRGLTNGRGMVNGRRKGLVNGAGLVNGRGLTNGNGMVNGRGLSNGRGAVNGNGMALDDGPPPRRSRAGWIAAAVVLSVLAASVLGYFLLVSMEKGVYVDGAFSDWSGARMVSDAKGDSADSETDILRTAVILDDASASFYARTDGRMLGGRLNGVDTVSFFVDADANAATGYRVGSVGAEYVLSVNGYDGRVTAAALYRFPSDGARPANDWNARTAAGACRAAASGQELETQVPLSDLGGGRGMSVQAYAKDSAGADDFGPVMAAGKSALSVTWRQTGPPSTAPGQSKVQLLRLELVAQGGPVSVSSIRLWANPGTTATDIGRMALCNASGKEIPGTAATISGGSVLFSPMTPVMAGIEEPTVLTVQTAVPTDARSGRAIGLSLASPADVSADTTAVTLAGAGLQETYVGSPSRQISIDGAFSDWDAVPSHADARGDVPNPDIDIVDFRLANDTASLYFMARVDGRMMGGAGIPETRLRPSGTGGGGGGGPITLPVLPGEDALFIFIDTDDDGSTGYSGAGVPIGADRLVKVTGQYGRIAERKLHSFTGGSDREKWSWSDGTDVNAATDSSRLEAGAALADLGSPAGNISVFYYTTDWKGGRDSGDRLGYDLRADAGGRGLPGGGTLMGGGEGAPWNGGPGVLHAPEFQDVVLPAAGVIGAFVFIRRRAGRNRRGS